jgi:hypothetical protein
LRHSQASSEETSTPVAPRDQFFLELLRSLEAGQLFAQGIEVDLGDQMVQWCHRVSTQTDIGDPKIEDKRYL